MPKRWANTPPRSMSPTTMAGMPARTASPRLTMSCSQQVDLGRAARRPRRPRRRSGRAATPAHRPRRPPGLLGGLVRGRLLHTHGAAQHDHLRGAFARRLEQDRVHGHLGLGARRDRLEPLGPADLAPFGGDHGVERHVLALERAPRLTPRRARTRQSPATNVDLPASDVVPHTMSAPCIPVVLAGMAHMDHKEHLTRRPRAHKCGRTPSVARQGGAPNPKGGVRGCETEGRLPGAAG